MKKNSKGSKGRGSRTTSPKSDPGRPSSPPSPKQAPKPGSQEEDRPLSIRFKEELEHQGLHRKYIGMGSVNFLKRNRQAVQTFIKRTGVPRTAGEPSEASSTQPRTKIGQPHLIGDELGTPSNKGSSFFLSASHNGVREPHKRVTAKKQQNADS